MPKTNHYLQFDGTTDIVNLGKGPQLSGAAPRTIEAWAYAESFNGGGIFQAGSTGSVGKDFSFRTMGSDNLWRVQLWGAPDFDVTLPGSKGAWHHYCITFDGSVAKVYFDGQFVQQKSVSLNTGLHDFILGRWAGSEFKGKIDEVRVWNKALDAATIAAWKDRSLDSSHPDYGFLLGYYPFAEGQGQYTADATGQQADGQLLGIPAWRLRRSQGLQHGKLSHKRPQAIWEQGVFNSQIDSVLAMDSVQHAPRQWVIYGHPSGPYIIPDNDPQHPSLPTDTLLAWTSAPGYVYNPMGQLVDSVLWAADTLIRREDHVYFSNIVRYEMMRFITPYGIGLDLGLEGKTWVFDVTDYAPILHDAVYLQSGNNQEVLDLRFVMIKGIPPRRVRKIETLWSGSATYSALLNNSRGEPIQKVLDPEGSMFRVKTRTSGHGFGGASNCAEFCPRTHYLDINGNRHFSWLVWKECSDNHIYPQGGTWIYDRAGWCPGSEVQEFDHELGSFVSPGDTIWLDYEIEHTNQPEGNYQLYSQLFTYDAPSFQVDASIEEILAPNKADVHSRYNPICGNPRIRIRNLGAQPLTEVFITFGVEKGFSSCYYLWEGNLGFLESAEIELPRFNWTGLDPNNPVFYAELSAPNQSQDENPYNDRLSVPFEITPAFGKQFIVEVKTNSAANENAYQIRKADGTVMLNRSVLFNNSIYRDTVSLEDGCYEFHFKDEGFLGQDGISWWANNDGTGYVRLRHVTGGLFRDYQPDFGNSIYEQFTVGYFIGGEFPSITCDSNVSIVPPIRGHDLQMSVFPNPSTGTFTLQWTSTLVQAATIQLFDTWGREIWRKEHVLSPNGELPLHLSLSPGMYYLKLQTPGGSQTQSLMIQP